jgi:hypothetical protein
MAYARAQVGETRARPLGGDRRFRPGRGAHDSRAYREAPDIAIEELRQTLADKGVTVIRRFFVRHAITREKRPSTRPSRTARHPEAAFGGLILFYSVTRITAADSDLA